VTEIPACLVDAWCSRMVRTLLAPNLHCHGWRNHHILGCCAERATPSGTAGPVGGSLLAMMSASAWGVLGVMVA